MIRMVKRKLCLWYILSLAMVSCTWCLDNSSLMFVHTEDIAEFPFMFLSFPCFLFILRNGLCSQSIMNYLVLFSFAAAQKTKMFLSELKIPALIALNSRLLISWSSAASPGGCPEPYWKNRRLVLTCNPHWRWEFIMAPCYILGHHFQ